MDEVKKDKNWLYALIALVIVCVGVVVFAKIGDNDEDLKSNDNKVMGTKQFSKAENVLKEGVDYKAVISTNKGDITIGLYEKETPVAVNNFVFLAQQHFYDGVIFHRVEPGFVIQGGDPTGTGRGGPGYYFDTEPNTRAYGKYSLGMANAGVDTNGSQFFITSGTISDAYLQALDYGAYVLFGEVIDGFDVVDAIESVPLNGNRPVDDVVINSVEITEG